MEISTEVLHDPAIQLQGIYPKECKSLYKTDTSTPVVTTAQFTIGSSIL
jgi:hypothetical protein